MALVDLYKVIWRRAVHNNANVQPMVSFVVAAAGAQATALLSTIQTQNGDGKTLTADHVETVMKGIVQ